MYADMMQDAQDKREEAILVQQKETDIIANMNDLYVDLEDVMMNEDLAGIPMPKTRLENHERLSALGHSIGPKHMRKFSLGDLMSQASTANASTRASTTRSGAPDSTSTQEGTPPS